MKRFALLVAFYSLVVFHGALVAAILGAFVTLPFTQPWNVAIPLMVFIWFFCTTHVECKLTALENYLRVKLGMRRIGGFVGHYLYKPVRHVIRPRKEQPRQESNPELFVRSET